MTSLLVSWGLLFLEWRQCTSYTTLFATPCSSTWIVLNCILFVIVLDYCSISSIGHLIRDCLMFLKCRWPSSLGASFSRFGCFVLRFRNWNKVLEFLEGQDEILWRFHNKPIKAFSCSLLFSVTGTLNLPCTSRRMVLYSLTVQSWCTITQSFVKTKKTRDN